MTDITQPVDSTMKRFRSRVLVIDMEGVDDYHQIEEALDILAEIFDEYCDVLARPKFHFPAELVDAVLDVILQKGLSLERTKTEEVFSDPKDVVFYEIALSKEGSYLVTGNTKHFPATPIVVTPAELLRILDSTK